MLQLDSENADRNLTSLVTVLTHTPDASNARLCVGYVAFGDGSKNLSAEGGDFELTIEVGGQTIQPSPQTITFGAVARAAAFTFQFPVPANASVVIKALSPNAGDTDVDVTARLYDAHVITPERAGYLDNISAGAVALQSLLSTVDGKVDIIDAIVDAILLDTGTDGVVVAAGSKAGYSLAAAGIDPVHVESSITAGAGLTDDAGSQLTAINLRQATSLILSAAAAVLAGAATTNITLKPAGKPSGNTRVDATVDANGNRSSLTLKVPT